MKKKNFVEAVRNLEAAVVEVLYKKECEKSDRERLAAAVGLVRDIRISEYIAEKDGKHHCLCCGQVIREGGWKNPASAENGKQGGRPCYGVELFGGTLVKVYRFRSRGDRDQWLDGAAYTQYRREATTAAAVIKEYGRKAIDEASEWESPMSEEEFWTPRK